MAANSDRGDEWTLRPDHEDITHIFDHILYYRAYGRMDDLEHAITRLAMVLTRRLERDTIVRE